MTTSSPSTRVITVLAAEVDRRRPLLTDLDVQAENLSAYLDKGHSMPRIVVLVDGFQNLPALLASPARASTGRSTGPPSSSASSPTAASWASTS